MKLGLITIAMLGAACTPATVATAIQYAPVVVGAVCQLAADQGAAEPGWEIQVCNVLDPMGNATSAQFLIHVPKGTKIQARRR